MFNWPRTIVKRGVIIVRGRHWTQTSSKAAENLMYVVMFLCMGVAGAIAFFEGQPIGLCIFLALLASVSAVFVAGAMYPILYLLTLVNTRVRITEETIEVAGIPYSRAAAPIQFTNLFPQAIKMSSSDGHHAMVGALQETTGLRMFYGSNAILITTFKSVQKASRFALACNAAVGRVITPAGGFEIIPVAELYRGDPTNLPAKQSPVG